MASTPVTAPSPDDSSPDDSSASPPPAPSNSSSSAPPPKSSQPSPPPPSPSPPPPSPSPPPSSPPPSSPPPPPSSPPPKSPPPPSSPPPPPLSPPPKSPPPPLSSSDESPSEDSSTPSSNKSAPPPPPPPPPQTSNSSSSSATIFFPPPPPKSSKSASSNAPPLTPPRSNNGGKSSPSGLQKSPPSSNDDTSASMSMPLVIGVVAGITVFLLIILVSALVFCCSKKKKKKHVMHYYDPAAPKGNEYYNNGGGAPQKWQPQGVDHNIKILPAPGLMMLPPGGGGWVPAPPAPLSGDMSLSYSGPQPAALPPPSPNIALGFNKSNFTYSELEAATGGFSQNNLLGQGGFGYVYKGYLPNGKEVAVKQLKSGSGQGEKEFQAEVEIISRVHHRHLVSLVGYCIAGAQRMLVYEFVPNNTLEYHLHGKGLPTMSWPTRLKIAIGSAKGFSYLHEDCHPRIIHRDIKAANILLDYKFEAMVADFGLAKLTSDTNTHVSTRIMGTFGYLAPEYASSGKLTDKSDVFSFGVMLLELITGRRPIDHTCMDDNLVDWARPIMTEALAEGNFEEIADPKLEGNYSTPEMARMVACAAACVRHSARRRPKMSQIVRALEGDGNLDDLHEGMKPGQSMFFSSSSDCNMGSYSNNMRQFRKAALGSGDYSEEYSGQATSEYGLNPSDSSGSSGEMHSGTRAHKPRRQL